jgi:integrase
MKKVSITPVLYPRKDKDGLYPVKIRITENRISRFENLGFSVSKPHWLKSTKRVSVSNTNHRELNFLIEKKLNEFTEVQEKNGIVHTGKINVFDGLEKKIGQFNGSQYYSKKRYRTLFYHLESFWGNRDLNYYDIDKDFFIDFKNYLLENMVARNTLTNIPSSNSIGNYLKVLRTFLLEKQTEGIYLYNMNNFKKVIPQQTRTPKKTLNQQELWKLDNTLPNHPGFRPMLWNTLNTFMFCFWSQGLRIGDCLRLKWGNIEDGVIVLRMEKTDRELIIQLNSSNIHRIKWYMSSYYPIWDWTNKKWNNYHQCDDFDPNKYNEWLFSHETDCQEFVNMIEEEKDENYQMMSLFTGPNFERIELDRYGSRYNKIIKDKVPALFESRDERLDMVNRELIKSISDYANKEENKNKFIFPFLRGFEDEKDLSKLSNKVGSSITLVNKSLRELGAILEIEKKFSTHWSRHSITSISKGLGVDIYDLKNWLGHTSVKTTESYVNTVNNHSFNRMVGEIHKSLEDSAGDLE